MRVMASGFGVRLNNPKHLRCEQLRKWKPSGIRPQRGREFSRFEDLDDRYDLRPRALGLPPKGDWGKGKAELVEIPTNDETNDRRLLTPRPTAGTG